MEPDYTNEEDRELYSRGYNDGYEDAHMSQQTEQADAQLLAQFACAALPMEETPYVTAWKAYEIADAMLAEHKKRIKGE